MVHGDSDPAMVRTAHRLPLLEAAAHLYLYLPVLAAAPVSLGTLPPAASLLRGPHAPPGKPLPLRV